MAIESEPAPWATMPRRRRNAMFGLALAVHALLVLTMLHARLPQATAPGSAIVEATIWLPRPATPTRSPMERKPPSVLRAPRPPMPVRVARPAPTAALVDVVPQAITLAPPAPASAASAVNVPLRLTLSRDQLKALIAETKPTLAQSLARDRAPTALESLTGDDRAFVERQLAGGVSEVHIHGGCFRLVPTARSQYDPFNHGGERLTSSCN